MHEVIAFDSVGFRYPDDTAWLVEDLSFSIQAGERVVMTGPSGCGKSTILYLINRLYPENCDGELKGHITIFGRHALEYAPGEVNHRVATVFQDPDSQFCMRTVEEELAFTLENLRTPRSEMDGKIADVLRLTELTEFRDAVIQQLSGGEKQRIALACALIMEPEILLLDEPLSHLDPLSARSFVCLLDRLQQERGFTVVAIEHRLDLWGRFFNRELELQGQPQLSGIKKRTPSIRKESALRVEKLCTSTFLQQASFTLQKGEVAVLAGQNGSGKSTMLKALAGLVPAKGTVAPKTLGYVPQSPEFLFVSKTVEEEIAYGGGQKSREIMEAMQLEQVAGSHPFAVSHGQKRRVAIAAMLNDGRDVILMDEPTSGQDAVSLQELSRLIDERAREGTAFLIVTHDMEFAYAIADRILLMKDGSLTGAFQADDVWREPKLLEAHRLLAPKGAMEYEASFA
ncbi:ABC transporter ATP-binding protein [Sporosarcina sp. NCCP-2222]|uniref:ABC transporter ATP-binding protein n=1 Tax=Sporosarcina sp. NCCP-2222 TaxID=2935073 RepID=UPI0020BE5BB2|nr:ABC transporter ATP-binding protein [Sporosarcina sp. NCCP-2222]